MKDKFQTAYRDVDEAFLKNMEMFLKYQFKSIKNQKKTKIKSIDALLSILNSGKEQINYSNEELVSQKLLATVDPNLKSDMNENLNEVPEDYKNINILKENQVEMYAQEKAADAAIKGFQINLNDTYNKRTSFHLKNEKKVLAGMNKILI